MNSNYVNHPKVTSDKAKVSEHGSMEKSPLPANYQDLSQLQIMRFQQTIGNRAVAQLLQSKFTRPQTNVKETPLQRSANQTGMSDPIIQRKINANNFKDFLEEQMELQQDVKQDPEIYEKKYTTVGFEHEFAQMTDGRLQGASHVTISESQERMPYTGIPFVLETDASDALELVSPPFLIETVGDKPIPDVDDVDKVDTIMKDTLTSHTSSNPTVSQLISEFQNDPGINFELKDVEVASGNMTPNTKDSVHKKEAKVSKDELEKIPLKPSTKMSSADKPHISTQVNFASDANTFNMLQELHAGSGMDGYTDFYSSIQTSLRDMLYQEVFSIELASSKDEIDSAITNIQKLQLLVANSIHKKVHQELHAAKYGKPSRFSLTKSAADRYIGTNENIKHTFMETTDGVLNELQKSYITPLGLENAIGQYREAIATLKESIENLNNDIGDDLVAGLIQEGAGPVKALSDEAGEALEQYPVIAEDKTNLKVFLDVLARSLSGQMALPTMKKLREAQEHRYKNPRSDKMGLIKQEHSDDMESKLKYEQMASSRVKDVKQVWIKDTVMNIGLGILQQGDWKRVEDALKSSGLRKRVKDFEAPKSLEPEKQMRNKDFAKAVLSALDQIVYDIKKNKLSQVDKKTGKAKTDGFNVFIGPSSQPDLFSHNKKWIGPRQDTYLNAQKVQMPEIWKDKRLHVIEVRNDIHERLKKLNTMNGGDN